MKNPFKPQPRKFSESSLKRTFKEFSISGINHYAPHFESPEIEYYLHNNVLSNHESTIRITFPEEQSLSEYGLQLKRFIESLPLSDRCIESWFDIEYMFRLGVRPVKTKMYKIEEKQ